MSNNDLTVLSVVAFVAAEGLRSAMLWYGARKK